MRLFGLVCLMLLAACSPSPQYEGMLTADQINAVLLTQLPNIQGPGAIVSDYTDGCDPVFKVHLQRNGFSVSQTLTADQIGRLVTPTLLASHLFDQVKRPLFAFFWKRTVTGGVCSNSTIVLDYTVLGAMKP